jgi:hypothetical protein
MISFFFFSYVSTHMCLMVRWGCFVGGMVALAIDGKGNVEKFGRRWDAFFFVSAGKRAGKGNKKENNHHTYCLKHCFELRGTSVG